jgi:hypothetical protein
MRIHLPQGALATAKTHEPSDEWPTLIEVAAYWGEGRKGRRRSVEISADQFFGRGQYGAPLSGNHLIMIVDRLRRQGPKPAGAAQR